MKISAKSSIILSTIIIFLGLFTIIYYSSPDSSPIIKQDCFSESNFTKAITYLEKSSPLSIDDSTIRIFKGRIIFDEKKGGIQGSISKDKGVTPSIIYGYEEMAVRMNNIFCTLVEKANQ